MSASAAATASFRSISLSSTRRSSRKPIQARDGGSSSFDSIVQKRASREGAPRLFSPPEKNKIESLSRLHPRLTLFFDALKLQKRKEKKRKRKTLNSLLLLASLRERRSLSGIAIAELRAQAARERERETELKRQARYVWKLKRGRTPLSPSNAPLSTSSWKEERAAPLPVAARASLISLITSAHSTLPRPSRMRGLGRALSPEAGRGLPPSFFLFFSLSSLSLEKKIELTSFLSLANTLPQAPSLPLESACVKMENGGVAAERAASAGKRRGKRKPSDASATTTTGGRGDRAAGSTPMLFFVVFPLWNAPSARFCLPSLALACLLLLLPQD